MHAQAVRRAQGRRVEIGGKAVKYMEGIAHIVAQAQAREDEIEVERYEPQPV